MRKLKACDLFCGAGGTSAGAEATGSVRVDFAVNHWSVAVQTHSANFPHTKHVNSRLDQVNPGECGKIDLLFASPECTHHSRARGGRPTSDQQRSGAWDLMRWIEHHRPSWIVVENVREFEQWGPVANGRPLVSGRGKFFESWLSAIKAGGYRVDYRLLNAADFGAATSRERLFVVARKGNRSPVLPESTHCQRPGGELPGFALPRWRPAAEIIDWSIPCPSIFSRKRPLADKTLMRIEAGLRRFCGPFVTEFNGGAERRNRSPFDPLGTVMAGATRFGLVVPFQIRLRNNGDAADVADPLATITAGGRHHGVAIPFIAGCGARDGQSPPKSITEPLNTVVTKDAKCLITPFLADVNHGGTESRLHSPADPLRTVTSKRGESLVYPFLATYYGNGGCSRVDCPIPTITTKDRVGLSSCVLCHGMVPPAVENPSAAMLSLLATMRELGVVDIGFRMLSNPELSAAQGFDADYIFIGTKSDITRQIGNSVSPNQAEAITVAIAAA